ncbi:hypothetical protein OMR07_19075, partial [Methylobacterium organophilum]|nr:hypothetical protein [Methylobacterium organophilum]
AAGWAVDEVSKHAVLGIRQQFHKHLKSNTPWTESAIKYKRSSAAGLNAIEAGTNDAGLFLAVYVMPRQNTYLKYLFGVQDNTRLPGDVGLAQDKILIPWWDNIKLTQGVQPTQYGGRTEGLPGAPVARGGGHEGQGQGVHGQPLGRLQGHDHAARPAAARLHRPASARAHRRDPADLLEPPGRPRGHRRAQDEAGRPPAHPVPRRRPGDLQAHPGAPLGGGLQRGRIPEIMAAQLADNPAHAAAKRGGTRMATRAPEIRTQPD